MLPSWVMPPMLIILCNKCCLLAYYVHCLGHLKDVYWVLGSALPVLLADANLLLDVAALIMHPPWDLHMLVHVDGFSAPHAHALQWCPRVRGCEVRQRHPVPSSGPCRAKALSVMTHYFIKVARTMRDLSWR
jgi:hypothetical protein